jgi:8-amino-7-oxononanoate synthase
MDPDSDPDSDPSTPPAPAVSPGKADIQRWLQLRIAEINQSSADEVDIHVPFSYYGLDSVAALGISGELEIWLGRKLSPTLTWDHLNIERLSAFLAHEA